MPPSRDTPLIPAQTALLLIDVQNLCAHRASPLFAELNEEEFARRYGWFFREFEEQTLPALRNLLAAARETRVEVIHTTIESLTKDGRDRSLDYKLSGFHVPKGAWEGKVLDALTPLEDEIVLPKTSSSPFISTNVDYLLRNMGIRQLLIAGLLTDQCIESAIRDAADLGYLVTQPTDACLTHTAERQAASLRAIQGYCRQRVTAQLTEEMRHAPARE